MEVEGYPGIIKTIGADEEVENFSEESDEEVEVWLLFQNILFLPQNI